MDEAIFAPRDMFKVAGKGLLVSGFLKKGVLKPGMEAEIKGRKITLLGLEAFNQKPEKIKDTDPVAKSFGIVLPDEAQELLSVSEDAEIIFKELK